MHPSNVKTVEMILPKITEYGTQNQKTTSQDRITYSTARLCKMKKNTGVRFLKQS